MDDSIRSRPRPSRNFFQWPRAVSSLTVARQRGILTRFPVFTERQRRAFRTTTKNQRSDEQKSETTVAMNLTAAHGDVKSARVKKSTSMQRFRFYAALPTSRRRPPAHPPRVAPNPKSRPSALRPTHGSSPIARPAAAPPPPALHRENHSG